MTGTVVKRLAVAAAAVGIAAGGLAADGGEASVAALRRALDGSASWAMERQIAGGVRTLRSAGTVECAVGSGIVWRVTAPFESSVAMTADAMVFADEEGVREKRLKELPHYAEIVEKTESFASGDRRAFEGLFEIEAGDLPPDGWRLTVKPEIPAMRRLFTEIELTGNSLPTNAVMKSADGSVCRIRFEAIGR